MFNMDGDCVTILLVAERKGNTGMYKVLVCDDDIAILEFIEIYLKLEGYQVFKATNGKDALQVAEKEELHCIILDIMMPEMDGLTVIRKLREEKNIPVIMLSAKSEDTDKITGLGFGADDYVTKPFNPLELVARVKSQIRRYTNLGSVPEQKKRAEDRRSSAGYQRQNRNGGRRTGKTDCHGV